MLFAGHIETTHLMFTCYSLVPIRNDRYSTNELFLFQRLRQKFHSLQFGANYIFDLQKGMTFIFI
jgi:hypothetical protein